VERRMLQKAARREAYRKYQHEVPFCIPFLHLG
jgi:protein-S-isoprenylcysteine O-methyltransferase Ste14